MVKPMKKLEKQQRAPEKDLKEDTTLLTPKNAEEYVQKIKPLATVLVVVCALLYLYFWYQGEVSKEADNHFGIAMVDIRLNNTDKAEAKLNEIITDYSGTDAADKATYFLAELYLGKGLFASSREYYENYSGSDEFLKSASQAGIALCYEKELKFEDAAQYYIQAVDMAGENGTNNADYLFAAGINYELANKQSEAKTVFERIKDDYPSYSKINLVEMKLVAL